MQTILPNFAPVIPEIFALIMSCVILLLCLFLEKKRDLPYYLAQITLLITTWLTFHVYYALDAHATVLTFHGTFILDKLALVLKIFIYASVFFTFIYSRNYNNERFIPNNEFYVLGLLGTLGMMVLASAHNLLTIFLGLELMSLPIYAMVALARGKPRCIEAAMKYFVIGSLASGLLLYGFSMLFGATKSLDISQIAKAVALLSKQQDLILVFGLVFVMAGLAFKVGAAPFHMWVPDVYDGAPTSVTLFLSTAPKLAAFAMIIRILVDAMPAFDVQWQQMWMVVALLSMAIGNIAAIVQANIKRMLAYSSIAHMGYMILGLLCATPRGNAAALFYIITYSIMTLGAFGTIAMMSKAGFDANNISDFSGLNSRNPWLAFIMMLIMFSLAGIPPLVGFIAKVGVLEALIQVHLVWLAVVAILFAIVGSYYYIRVVKTMYFEEPESRIEPITFSLDLKVAIGVNGIAVLLLGIFPGTLYGLSHLVF